MELPALIAVLVDAILLKCPQYDRTSVTMALESVFAGHSTLLGGNSISMLLGQNNDYTNATITIGDVHAGNQVHVTVQLPQPIDPLPAAFAALASIPLNDVPTPRSDLPQASRLPFESSPHFVGREEELKALAQAIGTAQPAVVMPAVATGLGGIGKTSLVTEFAYRYGVYFHGGVFWLSCADPDQVASQIAACALDLGIDPTGMAFDEQVQRVLNAWKSPMPRLLIFDNCDDPAILDQWKPTIGGCRVLVTARSDQWPTLTQIRLGLLSPAESRALLQRLCTRLSDAEADAIAEDLGHLPLALHLAGSYLNTYSHHTVEQYRTELTIAHRSLKGRGALPSPTRHEQDVEATFMLSFNQLDPTTALDALALGMLDGAAWCAPGVPIPRDLVLAFVPNETDADDAVDGLRRLQQLGLLDGTDALVLHRLLAQVVQARLGSTGMLAVMEDTINTMASHINDSGIPTRMLPLEPHVRHATTRALDRGDVRAARLANSLGVYDHMRGDYRESHKLLKCALEARKLVLGMTSSETAQSFHNLASVLLDLGRYNEAQNLLDSALYIRKIVLGTDHIDTAATFNLLALALLHQGRYSESQVLAELALKILEGMLRVDHIDTVKALNTLALVLSRQGHYRESQHLYERIVLLNESALGENHPSMAQSLNNLAFVLSCQGQYQNTLPLLIKSLTICEQVLGENHPLTLQSLNNLAGFLVSQQYYEDAQLIYERTVAILKPLLGLRNPQTLLAINNLAVTIMEQGDYDNAEPLFKQVVEINQIVFGVYHPNTASGINNLAMLLSRQKKYEEAQNLYEWALSIRKTILGSNHPVIAQSLNNLGMVLLYREHYIEAQSLLEEALNMYECTLGLNHLDTIGATNKLVDVLEKQGLYIEAQGLAERIVILYELTLGTTHPMTELAREYLEGLKERIQ